MKTIFNFLKRLFFFFLAMYLFSIAIGYGIVNILHPAKELTYTQTVQYITEGKVDSVELYSNDDSAEISLKNDDNRYKTNIPNEEVFCELVQENISKENNLEIVKTKKVGAFWRIIALICGISCFSIAFSNGNKRKFYNSVENEVQEEEKNKKKAGKATSFIQIMNDEDSYQPTFKKSTVQFSDVAGLKEEKEELAEIIEFLKNPEKYTEMGAKIPGGVLLSGAPGTGKTLLAKAVAGEAGVSFLSVSASEFDEKYVGVGASRIRDLFDIAKNNAPCIIFIDEIDAVGQKRTASDEGGRNQTIEQLLTEMDGFDTNSKIIVIAATNRLESLDPALVRPGRFDRSIQINLPDVHDREEILKIHGKNKKFMDNVSFEKIAHNTACFSGAELANLLNEAALIAVRKNQKAISEENIDEAMKKVVIGLQKKGRKISDEERKLTAYHEAGHAIISKLMATQNNVKEVSIIPRGTAGGYTWHETVEDKSYTSKTELTETLVVLLGGRAAEEIVLKDISTGASSDLKSATQIAQDMICVYGMNQEIGPISLVDTNPQLIGQETMSLIGKLITQTVKDAENKAKSILTDHRAMLDMVADRLLQKETISGDELDQIFEAYKNNWTTNV